MHVFVMIKSLGYDSTDTLLMCFDIDLLQQNFNGSIKLVAIKVSSSQEFQPSSLGPVVKSIVSLRSLLVVKMLTVLVSTIYNPQYVC